MTQSTNLPSHRVFHVTGEDDKAYWAPIGAAWAHRDGDGFNLELDMMPLKPGRIVIRTRKEQGEGQ